MLGRSLLFVVVIVVAASGCYAPSPTGQKVEARADALMELSKADFLDSQWYMHQLMVDVPHGAVRGFDGFTSSLERVRWEITEDYLIAYRAYEVAPGGDPSAGMSGWHEEPVAMYPIVEHVGEASAQWLERQAMLVDWTDRLDGVLWYGAPLLEGTSYTVRDADDPDGFVFSYFEPSPSRIPGIARNAFPPGALYHFDFTNRVAIEALESSLYDCRRPQDPDDYSRAFDPRAYEVGVRTSFLRVPEENDYEPVVYDAQDQERFGYFRVGRQAIDPYLGRRLSGRVHLATRHNIWADTWQRDDAGNRLRDDEGHLIPRPFAERTPRPIVYYLSEDFPPELQDAASRAGADWGRAFARAVAAAQGTASDEVPTMLVVCHNPVQSGDSELCGERGLRVRKGDLRFHQMVNIGQAQSCAPLGYGPSHPDPVSGQIIASQAVVYEEPVRYYAQYALDLIRFINGDLDIEGLSNADDVRQAVRDRLELPFELSGRDPAAVSLLRGEPGGLLSGSGPDGTRGEEVEDTAGLLRRRLETLEGSEWLELLADEDLDLVQAAGRPHHSGPGDLSAQLELLELSPIRPDQGCVYPTGVQDALLDRAREYLGRTDYDVIRQELLEGIYYTVMKHELGHTFGLRHNFGASADYLNYADEHWDLKAEGVYGVDLDIFGIGEVPLLHRLFFLDDVYYLARQTPSQVEGGMRRYAVSSVMDYVVDTFDQPDGVGKYDQAAILYGYTAGRDETVTGGHEGEPSFNTQQRGYVEVFDDPGDAAAILAYFEQRPAPEEARPVESVHYHTLLSYLASDGIDPFAQPPNLPADLDAAAALALERLRDRHLVRADQLGPQQHAVPYLYRADELRNLHQSARVFDRGADALEQTLDVINRYRDLYPLEYFGRDRVDFGPLTLAIRNASRYFLPLHDSFNRFYLGLSYPTIDFIANVSRQLSGLAAINMLAEVAGSTPSYGSYVQVGDRFERIDYQQVPEADLYLPPGAGRRFGSVVEYIPDNIEFRVLWYTEAGHRWTAEVALEVLAGVVPTYYMRPGAGVGATSAGPMDLFGPQLTTLYNSIFLQDSRALGPRVLEDGSGGHAVVRPPLVAFQFGPDFFLDPETFQPTVAPIDGSITAPVQPHLDVAHGYAQKLDAAVLGMALLLSPSSAGPGLQFQDQARIFRLDSGEQLTPGDGFETLSYCDTLGSGLCYGALVETGDVDPGVAARLILRAQSLHAAAEVGDPQALDELRGTVSDMDLLRSLYDTFGRLF